MKKYPLIINLIGPMNFKNVFLIFFVLMNYL